MKSGYIAACAILAATYTAWELYWLKHKLALFFYLKGDDVARIDWALHWARQPSFLPHHDWLPLPTYLMGLALRFLPEPHWVPAALHAFITGGALILVGAMALKLFPDRPVSSIIAVGLATQTPLLASNGLSAGAEMDFCFFALLALFAWAYYLEKESRMALTLCAASLFALSMTRYEAWLLAGCILFMAFFTVRAKEAWWVFPLFAAVSLTYIAFFVIFQEMHLPRLTSPEEFSNLPISYRGVRLYFRMNSIAGEPASSFGAPLGLMIRGYPWMALAGLAGALIALYRRSRALWYPPLIVCFFCLFCALPIIFRSPWREPRLLIIFHLLLAPLAGFAVACLLPNRKSVHVCAMAGALGLIFLGKSPPKELPALQEYPDTARIALAAHQACKALSLKPKVLFELRSMESNWEHVPLWFAFFDRLSYDRNPIWIHGQQALKIQDNPSIFDLNKAAAFQFLDRDKIILAVTHTAAARRILSQKFVPIAVLGDWTLWGRDLPLEMIAELRRRLL